MRKLVTEIELFSSLVDDEEQKSNAICTISWPSSEGLYWPLLAQLKQHIIKDFPKVFESLVEYF